MAEGLTILETESLEPIFKRIMKSHQLEVQDQQTKNSHKHNQKRTTVDIFYTGQYHCLNCDYQWFSQFSWVTIDFSLARIVKKWKMKCQFCYIECEPTFSMEQFEEMIEKAVQIYKGEYKSEGRRRGGYDFRPHRQELCEKCGYNRFNPCWERFVR